MMWYFFKINECIFHFYRGSTILSILTSSSINEYMKAVSECSLNSMIMNDGTTFLVKLLINNIILLA